MANSKHTVRNILFSILGIIVLLVAILFAFQYNHYRNDASPYRTMFVPRMELARFEITTMTTDKADMIGRVLIHNPLPINLRADTLSYKIFIGGVEVIKSTYDKSINIARWDSSWIELSVTTYTDKLFSTLKQAEKTGKDSIEYKVETSFGTKLLFKKEFNLQIAKVLPVFYIPEIQLDKIQYDSLRPEGVNLYFPMTIINKNKMEFKFEDLTYKIKLADNKWVSGTKPGIIRVKETDSSDLNLSLHISFKEIGKSILPLIVKGGATDFDIQLTLKMVSESNALQNSVILLNKKGVVHEIVRLAKDASADAKEKKEERKDKGMPEPEKKKIKLEKLHKSKTTDRKA